ncbi:MAG TPA: 4-alpha-glucanotransferase [Bacteroidales bacterium]|nr:4-alpha-glucanotransferase [Bacteroidales bacterium]
MNRGGKAAPDDNEEYFIYQTLTGVFPFGGVIDDNFLTRIDKYLLKALREAKTNTDWDKPDEDYEQAVISFTRNILKPGSDFLRTFIPFQKKVSDYGVVNSLTQLILKATAPGVPDFYQGTELWDLSMVDPDNRRTVNYEERFSQLIKLTYQEEIPENLYHDLFLTRDDGRIKLFLTWQLIAERNADPELFAYGKYLPLQVKGRFAEHIISYARVYRNRWFVVIAPLYLSALQGVSGMQEPGVVDWEDTVVILPDYAPLAWSASSGADNITPEGATLRVSEVLKAPCPVFLKAAKERMNRAAGVLAHISSLPGKYGTGDLGHEAYDFTDKLQENGQSYWQILPFNPVSEGLAWSPYSSASAFAGNTIIISPDLLVRSRLITEEAVQQINFRETYNSDLSLADQLRERLISMAYEVFSKSERPWEKKLFNDFCEKQKYWLDDFALFSVLKKEYHGKPWYDWPDAIMDRNVKSLTTIRLRYQEQIRTIKFAQYLFQKQWLELRDYCSVNGISIIGDVSFYVNYDSADMWAHPELFKLDADMNPLFVAGVPPDFFSETGQLWNMPVYNWDKMRKTGFDWWMNRMRRNLELCDIIRLDHFRGFSAYWEVPAGETTSVNGQWIEGPGRKFFDRVQKEFPSMPFIAEDLGDIDDKVYRLRDYYSLPGMVVLQFAFGSQTPTSPYIPHNYLRNSIVYTGTHDNNTTIGWFRNELEPEARRVAEEYIGHSIDQGRSNEDFIRLAYSSVAKIAIIPIQDILGLDEAARLNKPSTAENNWKWKMKKSDFQNPFFSRLRQLAVLYGRI